MKPRTRARTPSSIASNQSSKSKPSAATAASFVVSLVMAWSPFQRANAGIIWVEHPETTPTQFQPLPRRDRPGFADELIGSEAFEGLEQQPLQIAAAKVT